jgi:hypothetical protein
MRIGNYYLSVTEERVAFPYLGKNTQSIDFHNFILLFVSFIFIKVKTW